MLAVEAVNFKRKKLSSATWFQVLLQPPVPSLLVAFGALISLFGRALIFPFVKLCDCTQENTHVNSVQHLQISF